MLIAVFITEMVILHKYVYLLLLLFTIFDEFLTLFDTSTKEPHIKVGVP